MPFGSEPFFNETEKNGLTYALKRSVESFAKIYPLRAHRLRVKPEKN